MEAEKFMGDYVKQPSQPNSQNDIECSNKYQLTTIQTIVYDNVKFRADSNGYVHVFIDGACEKNGQLDAKGGIGVYFDSKNPFNVSEAAKKPITNNRSELQAAMKAIEIAAQLGILKLCINSDSLYVIKAVTQWRHQWKLADWKLTKGTKVQNEDLFKELEVLLKSNKQMNRIWNYTPGHRGIFGNEMADKLAKAGVHL